MKARLTLSLALLLICTGAGTAMAQGTPDHMPPALETVCDMEQGAAYGHCNAYCEAMDCDLAHDNDPTTEPHASATACAKVRSKFQQTTGRDLPCEVTCPCADPAASGSFAAILSGARPVNNCSTSLLDSSGIFINTFLFFTEAFAGVNQTGQWFCGSFLGGLPVSPEQGQFCADLLEQKANSEGVTCTP